MNGYEQLKEAMSGLFENGLIPEPRSLAACMPCINGEGFSPTNEWCTRCGDTRKKCEAIYKATESLRQMPRNCDVGTWQEQAIRFMQFCMSNSQYEYGDMTIADRNCSINCPCHGCLDRKNCLTKWAQMPYEVMKKARSDGYCGVHSCIL